MLTITVPGEEYYDEEKQRFLTVNDTTLEFEHSLASLSKWESKWEKPFLSTDNKSPEQVLDYITRCMLLTPNVPPEIFHKFTQENFKEINSYIEAKMSATWFNETQKPTGPRRKEVITAEIIYYWMDELKIDLKWENRHLARLFTLIKVHNEKNQPEKKTDRKALMERNRRLNEERLAKLGTKG